MRGGAAWVVSQPLGHMRRLRTSRLAWLLAALAALQSVQRGTCAAQETTQDLYSTSHQRPGGNAPVDSAEQGSSTSRQKPDAAIGDLPSHGPHDPLPMGHANARLELLRCRGKASKAPSKLCTHLVEDMGFSCDDVTVRNLFAARQCAKPWMVLSPLQGTLCRPQHHILVLDQDSSLRDEPFCLSTPSPASPGVFRRNQRTASFWVSTGFR